MGRMRARLVYYQGKEYTVLNGGREHLVWIRQGRDWRARKFIVYGTCIH